jgi:hypothetical protein
MGMNRINMIFCIGSLAVSLLVAAIGFSFAALPSDVLSRYRTPVSPEVLPAIAIKGYGRVAVSDLVDFYIENPPETGPAGGSGREVQFQGC